MTQGDHLAIGDPHEDRRGLARGDRDHDLVQERHSLACLSLQDQRVPAAQPREDGRVGIRQALGCLPRIDEAREDLRVSLEQARQGGEHQQPGLLDALHAAFLQEPATAGDPPHRRSQVAAKEETERLPESTVCGTLDIAAGQPRMVGGDPGLLASVVASDQVRGNGKALEILGPSCPSR